ncbi:DUF4439 domain-containing protein [Nocardioides sp. BP30]|uniref:DUF4439 domain-containing protein n=1 Tax=Nocardioides sp. BP30 TaxID=3036374 RepID=UPI002468E3B3|nr:DUF4439 domain-containing protein [Nocardioides sp. BP30]WGL53752.1 DUF4439 domain-containing protein [Nocardioides sp. BP30]
MSDTLVARLRTALAAEHAAVYVLAALSTRTSPGALADALRASYDFHRAARDALAERLAALGDIAPPGAAPAYDLPAGLGTSAGVSAAALALEQASAVGYGDLVAATTGSDRTRSIGWLSATAVRQLGFGGKPSDLPGIV